MQTGQPLVKQDCIVAADGQDRWYQVSLKPFVDSKGQTQGIIANAIDITDLHFAEATLRRSQQQYQTLVNSVDAIVWRGELKHGVFELTFVSEQAERMLGYPLERWLEPNFWLSHVHPDDRDRAIAYCAECIEARQDHVLKYRMQAADGRFVWIEDNTRVIVENGQVQQILGLFTDISDRKQTELLLEQQQQTLRAIIDHAPVWIWMIDRHRKVHLVNKTFADQVGISEASFLAVDDYVKLFGAEAAVPCIESDTACWAADVPARSIETQRLADGRLHTLEVIKTQLKDPDGKSTRLIGIALDVSDRIAAETALRHSEAGYRTLVDNLPGMVYRCANDRNWSAHYLSDRVFELTGYLASELMAPGGRVFGSIIHPDDAEALWTSTQEAIDRESPYQDEYRIIHATGEIRWILDRGRICYAPDGRVLWFDGILFDITDRKRAEDQLRDLSDRLSLAVKSGAIGIWEWDIVQNKVIWDDRTCELYGVERADFSGDYQGWSSKLHPDDLAATNAIAARALRGEQEYDAEFRVIHPDRTVRFIKGYGLVQRNAAGKPQRMIGINLDISDRRQAEDKLRQANETLAIANLELARANRLKDEFLANMSHELRTPLNAVLGLSKALQEEAFGSLNDRQRQFVETISSSGDHLLALLNDILGLAKIESGRFDLELATASIPALCRTSLSFIKPLAQQKNFSIDAQLPLESSLAVLDERRICQVLINLLNNAVKFTPTGGQITLRVEASSSATCIRFFVIDTGIGIAKADQVLLFQPFVQIDSSLSRHYDGTGLGLALVKQIVELHGGDVSVESELGKGSCFIVTLPCDRV